MLGLRTGPSPPRQKVNEYKEQNISGALVPTPGTAARMELVLASNLIVDLSGTASAQAGATEPGQSQGQVVTGSFQLTAGLGGNICSYIF